MDVEGIIQCIKQDDQNGMRAQLLQFNREYAKCFFFDMEKRERKKQLELEEFRRTKVREYVSDSESDYEDETGDPEQILRQSLAAVLIRFVQCEPQARLLRVCLRSLRILSRDKKVLAPLVTDTALLTLARLGGISDAPLPDDAPDHDPYGDIIEIVARVRSRQKKNADDNDDDGEGGDEDGDVNGGGVRCEAAACDPAETQSDDVTGKALADADGEVYLTVGSCADACRRSSVFRALVRGKRDSRGSSADEGEDEEEEEEEGEKEEVKRKEVMKILCNIIYNNERAQKRTSELRLLSGLAERLARESHEAAPPFGQFYELRLMFLRPELRAQLHQEGGVSVLTSVLEQCLSVRWRERYEAVLEPTAPPVSVEESKRAQEILKILFNITHSTHTQQPDEEEAALYRHLAAVLRHCLMVSCEGEEETDALKGHTVNLLSALPLGCLDVLLSVPPDPSTPQWEGLNMACVDTLLQYMERKLDRGQKVKEKLTPVLSLLTECCRAHRQTRRYLRQQILPPLRDASSRPEEGSTVKSRLVRLMTHLDTELKHCAADLLFVLCKESVSRFVKYTGYGNAAGLLATRGLLGGLGSKSVSTATQYSSDSDSDTEEYRQVKGRVNPVTGRVEEEQPDPMEGMTEEEKEEEARRLVCLFNQLSRENLVLPMGMTAQGPLQDLAMAGQRDPEGESDKERDKLEDVE